mgnify:CR=1 FL=1
MASDVLPASIEPSLPSDGLNNSRLVTVGAGTGLLSEWDPPDYSQTNLTAGVSTSNSKERKNGACHKAFRRNDNRCWRQKNVLTTTFLLLSLPQSLGYDLPSMGLLGLKLWRASSSVSAAKHEGAHVGC